MGKQQRFLILPARGLQATAEGASAAVVATLTGLTDVTTVKGLRARLQTTVKSAAKKAKRKVQTAAELPFEVLDSINEDGVKLVATTSEMMAALRYDQPGLRAVPEVFYRPALHVIELRKRLTKPAAAGVSVAKKLKVTVVLAGTTNPVRGVRIVAFTDFANREGVEGRTSTSGQVTLTVLGGATYQRVYVLPDQPGLWDSLKKNVPTQGSLTIKLAPLELGVKDSLRHFHQLGSDTSGTGVKVGVIDSGVDASHADLQVAGGLGCVPGSDPDEFGPSGSHGTHVAGIIAGRGQVPTGIRGIAPAAQIYSYRVFDDSQFSGSSFGLVKAIRQGIADGCDLLNMSLSLNPDPNTGQSVVDEAIQEAVANAYEAGIVVLAAAGNDGRRPVSYPAFDDLVVAVSAVGRKGTFPARTVATGDVTAPFGADPLDFLAAFSNIGTELDMTGAGVGVVSTVPGGYAPMSGTSMACPAVTGVLARLLALHPDVLALPRNSGRAEAIKALLYAQAKSLGLGLKFEGKGLPQ